jgi:hypothetical protein
MRLSWQTTVGTALSVGIILVLLHEIIGLKRNRGNDPRVFEYLQKIQPVEKELEDVRHNLFEISKGVHVHESISHIEYDANRETAQLADMRSVPEDFTGAQEDFLVWAHILQGSVPLAKEKPTNSTRRQLAENVSKADNLYRRIEMKVAPEER